MVTSPNEWKILKWDELQTNRQSGLQSRPSTNQTCCDTYTGPRFLRSHSRTVLFDILRPILAWIPFYIWSIACFILSSVTSTQYPVFPTQDPLLPVLRCSNSFRVVALSVGSEVNFVTWSFMYNLRKYNLFIYFLPPLHGWNIAEKA